MIIDNKLRRILVYLVYSILLVCIGLFLIYSGYIILNIQPVKFKVCEYQEVRCYQTITKMVGKVAFQEREYGECKSPNYPYATKECIKWSDG